MQVRLSLFESVELSVARPVFVKAKVDFALGTSNVFQGLAAPVLAVLTVYSPLGNVSNLVQPHDRDRSFSLQSCGRWRDCRD